MKTPNGIVLKELPKNLRYAFLGENGTKAYKTLIGISNY